MLTYPIFCYYDGFKILQISFRHIKPRTFQNSNFIANRKFSIKISKLPHFNIGITSIRSIIQVFNTSVLFRPLQLSHKSNNYYRNCKTFSKKS